MEISVGKLAVFTIAVVASAQESNAKLDVLTYDLAGLSPPILFGAEREAAKVFAAGGIEVRWMRGSSAAPEAHELDFSGRMSGRADCQGRPRSILRLRIVASAPPGVNERVLGLALPCAKFGLDATIFGDRIGKMAESVVADLPKVLGLAMAHELGHVLLRSENHSANGLMRARWSQSDFHSVETGRLLFTAEEADKIRKEVGGGSRAPSSTSSYASDERK